MEINKQLFEDVLSGKLKGTFVLRCGIKTSSDELSFNNDYDKEKYPYTLWKMSYTPEGYFRVGEWTGGLLIIDFIPDTDMKENKLTIEIPEGKTVDWEASQKQNKIIFKEDEKPLTYEDICDKLYENNPTFEHQFECLLAKNKLANIAKYLNDGWKPENGEEYYTLVYDRGNKKIINSYKSLYYNIGDFIFKTKELAQQAIEILGEETIKLALEPLGI